MRGRLIAEMGHAISVQAWRFEETVAVGGGDAQLEHAAGAMDCEGNLDTRVAQRPDTAEEACQVPNCPACNGEHDVGRLDTGRLGGSSRRQADDQDLVLGFARINPKPVAAEAD